MVNFPYTPYIFSYIQEYEVQYGVVGLEINGYFRDLPPEVQVHVYGVRSTYTTSRYYYTEQSNT